MCRSFSHSLLRASIVLIGFITVGCAKDVRPIYSKPTLADNEVAVLKGTCNFLMGTTTYVDEVDGARVDNGMIISALPPTTKVTPGEHTIGVMVWQQSRYSSSARTARFKFAFEPGHVYEMERNDLFDARTNLKDKTTGRQIVIE